MVKIKNDLKKKNFLAGIGHFCLQITILMLVWKFLLPLPKESRIPDFLFPIITGIGAMMIYIPIGVKLEEIRRKYGNKIKNENRI